MLNGILFWQLRQLPRILGWSGLAAAGVAAAVVLFQANAISPLKASMLELRAEVENLGAHTASRRAAETSLDPGAQLSEFYHFFPEGDATLDTDAMTGVLARIYEIAAQENIILEHGEYQLSQAQQDRLLRYGLTLPINATYPKLRRFMAKVLQDNPSLALDGVSFSRQMAVDIGVNAQVRMTLYLRAGPL